MTADRGFDSASAELVDTAEPSAERMTSTVHELQLLQEAAQELSSTLDREAIFLHTVSAAARLMTPVGMSPCRAALLLVDGDTATIVAEYDVTGASIRDEVYRIGEHEMVRSAMETGQTVVADVRAGAATDGGLVGLRRIGILWSAVAPIVAEGRVTALVRVSTRDDRPFTDAQRDRLTALAQVAGLALGNAERYRLARSEAERAGELEEIKSQFLRLASHELRGPIAILGGYLSMLEDGSLPGASGQAKAILPLLSAKVNEMKRMVDDMLETARLEDRRLDLTIVTVDLRDIARRAVDTLRPLLTERHQLVFRVVPEPLQVRVDRERTETVISNLLDNAVKYSPAGGRVECDVRAEDGQAVVTVRDHGIGIAEEDLGRLFTRFGRIVTPDNSHIAGTGLGLHLAQRLAALHGGEITVESLPGEGSTFTLRLALQP
jgi:signal transduction histidine kinase